ncbi:MAG: beta-propeller fold lactonase family protein [Planctomycetes bacterium]|nr:beta-propeller fold lactonase family protein [Planctomycetota bacterium]
MHEAPTVAEPAPSPRSPIHVCLSSDGLWAYVVNFTAHSVSILDTRTREVAAEIPVGPRPAHAAASPDGRFLYVSTLDADAVDVLDTAARRVALRIPTGFGPFGMALSADGKRISVANSLSDSVSVIDLPSGKTLFEVPVGRNPRYLCETPDGRRLLVSNSLSRDVSVVSLETGRVVETRRLGEAALLRQIGCSSDGRWAFVVHLISRDSQLPVQIERGWIHSNGFSALEMAKPGNGFTLLLDRLLAGAANPWGLALSSDQRWMYVSLAGVHQVAIVDLPRALGLAPGSDPRAIELLAQNVEILDGAGILRRVAAGGIGPRGLALDEARGELWVCNYFSDTVSVLDAASGGLRTAVPLGPTPAASLERRGEMLFNDARICFQGWFTCASCHQEDATIDGLNWDLINDGVGNPKNTKSLYDIHDTPPAMWSGVRETLEEAVAAGQRFLGYFPRPENHAALVAYISGLTHLRNPYRGRSEDAIRRGERLFRQARCDACHKPPTFSDGLKHDLGLTSPSDPFSRIDTPSLRDCFRTAPYLHDGRAPTLESIFTEQDPERNHGNLGVLSGEEVADLVAYLKTL